MTRSPNTGARRSRARQAIRSLTVLLVGLAGFGIAALTGLALAKSVSTVDVQKNVTDSMRAGEKVTIDVNAHGRPVYELVPETTHHALCTKADGCFGVWFPVKVPSRQTKLTAAPGVKGKLTTWHRDRFYQVTLGGHPLYTFAGDTKKNVATGDTLKSFGGEWHLITPSGATTKSGSTTTNPTTTMTTTTGTTTTSTMPTTPYYPPY